jgi:hypothetical protein
MLNRIFNREFINFKFPEMDFYGFVRKFYWDSGYLGKIKYYLRETGGRHPVLKNLSILSILKYKSLQIITAPFIYLCFIPTLGMDVIVTLYQRVCFPLYGIPLVKRKDYVVIDRHKLKYLNFSKKFNCVYCGYFTGVISYAQEIAGRTEQYWCPIKHAAKLKNSHNRYQSFMEYDDEKGYLKNFVKIREFNEPRNE